MGRRKSLRDSALTEEVENPDVVCFASGTDRGVEGTSVTDSRGKLAQLSGNLLADRRDDGLSEQTASGDDALTARDHGHLGTRSVRNK